MYASSPIPAAFWWRRLHSLMGFGLVIYIIFHLFTNSQAALEDGRSYIRSVNAIQELPFLIILEILILGIPIAIHAGFGIKYLWTGEMNSFGYDGKHPYLPEYGRNRAYSWQRITSWILLFGIIFHVVHMRFVEQPIKVGTDPHPNYLVRLDTDAGLATLSGRLDFQLMKQTDSIQNMPLRLLGKDQVFALTHDYGTAELLMVRNAFKSPLLMLIYTLFVLAACFHAFNGLWTFLITWGISLTTLSQRWMLYFSTFLMAVVTFLGLAAVFGTYWINLRT